jgi:transposase InsO family protein
MYIQTGSRPGDRSFSKGLLGVFGDAETKPDSSPPARLFWSARDTMSGASTSHTIFPYLLRKLPVTRPNQVWAMDITHIPMAQGFVYLAAVVDRYHNR